MPDPVDARPDTDGCTTIADWARHRKRRREDVKKDNGNLSLSLSLPLCICFCCLFEKKNSRVSIILHW